MLRKLLKYEWQATARTLLPLYGGVILLAIINRLLWSPWMSYSERLSPDSTPGWVQGIAMTVYISIMVASFVITFVILIQRFYKSLLGDEGYLMFTLPVSPALHIWSKTIIGSIMSALSGVAAMISILILGTSMEMWNEMFSLFGEIMRDLFSSPHYPLYVLEMLILLILNMVAGMLAIYLCIAIGHLAKRHRVAAAVGAYFGLSIVMQMLLGFATSLLVRIADAGLLDWMDQLSWQTLTHLGLLGMCLLGVALGAVSFAGTNYILKNKLNLE